MKTFTMDIQPNEYDYNDEALVLLQNLIHEIRSELAPKYSHAEDMWTRGDRFNDDYYLADIILRTYEQNEFMESPKAIVILALEHAAKVDYSCLFDGIWS